ncbi:MAG TPA: ABC transporter ATP-binding protein [Thermomicrobiales bacterium]|nr:ABC transporter ATP-binding protein [Thermomicrobiales bacterium]
MPLPTTLDRSEPDTTTPVIEVRNLRRSFGSFLALDDITMTVPRASVGLLGANGAGKTTLIRTLLGLLAPDRGEATVVGYDIRSEGTSLRAYVGYMPEAEGLPSNTTAADFVGHMAEMSGIPPRAARQRAADVLYQVGLAEERYRLIKGFSTGMRQRVKLAQAIVHDPQLVFLDEPTAGLDPRGREEMLELITRIYRQLGIAVVVSTHILEDVEKVCDYVLILDAGRLVAAQPLGAMEVIGGEVTVRIDGDQAAFRSGLEAQGVSVHDGGPETPDELSVDVHDEAVYDVIRDLAVQQGAAIRSMRSMSRSLEDIYLGNVGASREEVGAGV